MYRRLCNPSKERSFFLFGPRGVGKTWLLRSLFVTPPDSFVNVNLLEDQTYLELLADPSRIRRYVKVDPALESQWIIIDEVQRAPAILHEAHSLLEDPLYHGKLFFAFTGSSARKLKRGGADLLAGRALVNHLYPLSIFETLDDWGLDQALSWGALPAVVTASSDTLRTDILRAYVSTYLKEEIKEEQIVRKLEPFVRFLEVAAQANGELVTYSKIANAALVDQKAVARYFEILEDTLLGFFLAPYTRSARERALKLAKFYFFDIGVVRAIERALDSPLRPRSSEWGRSFEHFVILECIALNSYFKRDARFSYLRTKDGAEIDLIIEKGRAAPLCIEIKSSLNVSESEAARLVRITQAVPRGEPIVVYDGKEEQQVSGVRILPWKTFLAETWIS